MRAENVRALLDLLPVLVAFVDGQGSVGWANRGFHDLLESPEDSACSTNIAELFPGIREDIPAIIREVIGTGVPKTGITGTVDLPGSGTKTLTLDILPCNGKKDGPARVVLFATDITDKAQMEQLKKETYEQIEKNIEQFAILGDHIRNPVSVITGLCDLLEDREIAQKIISQAREIDRIVTQIDQGWIDSEKVRTIIKKYYDVGVSGTHELVARAIHEEYIARQKETGQTPETNPSMRPWSELPRNLRDSNLQQADDIWKKLSEVHCAIGLSVDKRPVPFEFTPDEIELLAMHEHERWVNEKRRRGWTCGPAIRTEERTHTCLVPWRQLPEDQKEKDRNAIRTLPAILSRVRLKIVRLT